MGGKRERKRVGGERRREGGKGKLHVGGVYTYMYVRQLMNAPFLAML